MRSLAPRLTSRFGRFFGQKTAGIAGYFEDFLPEERSKIPLSWDDKLRILKYDRYILCNMLALCQSIFPQHLLSRWLGRVMRMETPWIKNLLINWFIRHYQIDLTQAESADPRAYRHFNHFFTRGLRHDARPIADDPLAIVSPVDGTISQIGRIANQQLLQAKGQTYSLPQLLSSAPLAAQFEGGAFATVYLAPRDYHRVHMPASGRLMEMTYVPGCLFSVNKKSVNSVPRLFARNERVICVFATEHGPMLVVLIGALLVASIVTAWSGQVTPRPHEITHWSYVNHHIELHKGQELGYFQYGSTVITLFPPQMMQWREDLQADISLQMGQQIGKITQVSPPMRNIKG